MGKRSSSEPVTSVLLTGCKEGHTSLLKAALDESAGTYRVQCEELFVAALARLAAEEFDCVIVELGSPDAQGLAVIEALHEAAGATAIVVVLAGETDEAFGFQLRQRDSNDYLLMHDVSPRELHRSIECAVDRKRAGGLADAASGRQYAVMDSISDGVLVTDADGLVVSANSAASSLTQVSGADLLGQPVAEIPQSLIRRDGTLLPDAERPGSETLASGEPVQGVVAGLTDAAGAITWVEMNASPLHHADGRVDGVVVAMRDITDRLAAEDKSRFQAALLAAVGQAVIVSDLEGRIIFWNPAAEELYGWTEAEAVGRSVVDLVPAESAVQATEIMAALTAGESWTGDFLVRRRDGTTFSVLVTDTPVFDDKGEFVAIIGVSTDITERRKSEKAADELSAIVESTADAVFTKTLDGIIRTWNRGAEQVYGYRAEEIIGQHVNTLAPNHSYENRTILAAIEAGETIQALETVRRHRDGADLDVSLTVSPIHDENGAVSGASVIGRDISDRKRLERELARQAMHDSLTGLANRTLLGDRLKQALARGTRRGTPVAVLFLDIDQFKTVNDANGHLAGDQLLIEVAMRLCSVVRTADTVARFGGDEFVLVCEESDTTEAMDLADRIAIALSAPITVHGQRQYVSASIGIAVTPPLEPDPTALLRYADAAMYDAKAHGRARFRVFDASLAKQSTERLELTNDLRQALTEGTLEVHYQPVVELATGNFIGIEALSRWQHPTRGSVPPGVFVPLAEETGLIAALDRWVLARACHDAAMLRSSGVLLPHARLAVNISARNVGDRDMVDVVRRSAADAGLPLDVLELELTETGLMADPSAALRVLAELRKLGVGIALDDFGTGYSSLTYLHQLPVTAIKIDRSFVQHITVRPSDMAIAASVIDLARAVGLRTVAEGVETVEQLTLLHQLGCLEGQGFLWSRALPPAELVALRQGTPRFLAAPAATPEPQQSASAPLRHSS
ncbi:MAG: EAL domain-containing protein [Actinomycetota bacterium]